MFFRLLERHKQVHGKDQFERLPDSMKYK